jgi:hypothetical protein
MKYKRLRVVVSYLFDKNICCQLEGFSIVFFDGRPGRFGVGQKVQWSVHHL